MKQLVLIGGGGHCSSCVDVIEQEGVYEIIGILDKPELVGQKVLGYEIIGTDEDIAKFVSKGVYFLITVGQIQSPKLRKKIFQELKRNDALIAKVISPRAYVSQHASIKEGTVVMHDALINAGATVGRNCIINTKSLIEHDSEIHDHCHISTASVINGGVVVQEGTFFGSGSVSREYVTTAKDDFIKAGSVFLGESK